jgi:RNA polymerase sigma-70 factor (ECF subfamily)
MDETHDDYCYVHLLQKGNVVAFDSLFEKYSPKLFGFSMKYLKNESEAEELVQDVFVQVWEGRQMLKTEYSFKSYLFTIALNQIRRHFNKKAISLRYLESIQNDPDQTINEIIRKDEYESTLQLINNIIGQMPPRRREIFTRRKLEGKSTKEIAEEFNISAGTIDNQVSEALHFIRSRLNNGNFKLLLFVYMFIY